MELIFAGAAREATGSCHLVRANGRTIALDCGLFQGRRSETEAKNRLLPLPIAELDAVILSHAHIDHAGRLPLLVREGYAKQIWSTAATRDLCAYMLLDSAHIQEKDAEFLTRRHKAHAEPLYGMRDTTLSLERMIGVPYRHTFDVVPGPSESRGSAPAESFLVEGIKIGIIAPWNYPLQLTLAPAVAAGPRRGPLAPQARRPLRDRQGHRQRWFNGWDG